MVRLVIAGSAQSPIRLEPEPRRLEELIFETSAAALRDAGITRDQVDNVVLAASDMVDGRCISSMLTANAAGAYLKDEIKVADEGAFGVVIAALRLMTGHFHTSLVVSWSKPSEGPDYLGNPLMADPFYHRPFGINPLTAAAMLAGAYRKQWNVPEEASARVVVKNRARGSRNPNLEGVETVTVDEVLGSPRVAYPLRSLELARPADGACALVLTTEERARDLPNPAVRLSGLGWAADSYYLGERDLGRMQALEIAARQAYRMADIRDPAVQLDVAEVSDFTAYHELMACEALGLCAPGQAAWFAGSQEKVNPSGGSLSAFPVFSAGLHRVVEIYRQLSGRAGGHQVQGARRGLAHGSAGFAGQTHAVFVLSGEE